MSQGNGAEPYFPPDPAGSLVAHGENKTDSDVRPQHAGLGRRLIQAAEILAMSRGKIEPDCVDTRLSVS